MSSISNSNLTIEELLSLPRPQAGILSPNSKLALWNTTKFSFEDSRTEKSVFLVKVGESSSTIAPQKILEGLTSLECAWIDDHTFLYLRPKVVEEVEGEVRGLDHPLGLSDLNQKKRLGALKETAGEGVEIWAKDVEDGSEYQVASLPVE